MGLPQPPVDFLDVIDVPNLSALMQYVMSSDRADFAARYHPLLPAELVRRIESSDPSLTSLEIQGDHSSGVLSRFLGERGGRALARSLALNTCITSLNLSGNAIGSGGLAVLLPALTHLTALTKLDLSYNRLINWCDKLLASSPSLNTCITSLNLEGNQLGSGGLVALLPALTHLTALTNIDLSYNYLTVKDGVRIFGAAAAAGMIGLQRLGLGSNGFDASSVVGSTLWRHLGLPQPPDEIIKRGFDALTQYLFSEDKVASNCIRIFVIGESTVRNPVHIFCSLLCFSF
jgi:hypothetical protein